MNAAIQDGDIGQFSIPGRNVSPPRE